jgi:hypothetical protein
MAEAVKTLPPDEPARLVAPLTIDRRQQAEFSRMVYTVILPAGVEPDDILPVAFWTHFGEELRLAKLQGEVEIIATAEDLKWRGELIVVDAGANWARVCFKTTEDGKRFITKLGGLQAQKVVMLPGHTVNYSGVFSKWRVVRDADGKMLRDKFNSEGDAYSWLSDYAKSIQQR